MTTTGTLREVPRKPDELPEDIATDLIAAQSIADTARAEFKAAVVDALAHASVRQVAKVTGLSPTTVQAWKNEAR